MTKIGVRCENILHSESGDDKFVILVCTAESTALKLHKQNGKCTRAYWYTGAQMKAFGPPESS